MPPAGKNVSLAIGLRASSKFSASEIREPEVKYVVMELPEHVGSIHFLEESLLSPYNTTLDLCSTAVFDVEEAAGHLRKAPPQFLCRMVARSGSCLSTVLLKSVGLPWSLQQVFPTMVHYMRKLLRLLSRMTIGVAPSHSSDAWFVRDSAIRTSS